MRWLNTVYTNMIVHVCTVCNISNLQVHLYKFKGWYTVIFNHFHQVWFLVWAGDVLGQIFKQDFFHSCKCFDLECSIHCVTVEPNNYVISVMISWSIRVLDSYISWSLQYISKDWQADHYIHIYAVNKKGVSCRKQGISWRKIAFLFKCS